MQYDVHSEGMGDLSAKSLSDNTNCPCKRIKCERHGNCAACREHHAVKGKPVACERPDKHERRRRER